MAIKFGNSLDLNNNELLNAVIQNLAGDSTTQKAGLIWFDTTNGIKRIKVYDGTSVKQIPYVGEKASDSDKLGGTAATAFLTKTEANSTYATKGLMGASNGIATLGEDGKVPSTQLPDYLLGQLLYGGTIVNNVATVSQKFKDRFGYSNSTLTITANNATSYEGVYFIARGTNSVIAGNTVAGDWVVSDGISWNKIDNTDAVVSVAGLTGTITTAQLSNALGLDEFVTSTDFQDIADTANSALQGGKSGVPTYLTVSTVGTELTITPIIGSIDGNDGLALTSDIEEKVIGQSGDTATDLTLHGIQNSVTEIKESDVFKFAITQLSTDYEDKLWFDTVEGDDHHFMLCGVEELATLTDVEVYVDDSIASLFTTNQEFLTSLSEYIAEEWQVHFSENIETAFEHEYFVDNLDNYLDDRNYVDKDFLSEYVTGQLASRPKKFVKNLDAQDIGWLENRTHNIQHNLGTKSVSVTIINDENDVVYADVRIVDENNIRVIFGNTPQMSWVDVVVIG